VREDDEITAVSGSTRAERRRDPSRVLALTDGVFAIIITLLVLDIHVPELSAHESLGTAVSAVRPSFTSFVIAFIVAAMQWVGHRDLFTLIRYTDRGIIWLNLLTLFAVCLLPFGSALLSHYNEDPVALRMFGLILIGTSVARTAIWAYATHRPELIHEPLDRASIRSGLALSAFPLVVYLIAFGVARVSPQASLAVYASGPVLYFIAITLLHWLAPRGSAERQFT
jgi:TMEM175 potassium channel family protein